MAVSVGVDVGVDVGVGVNVAVAVGVKVGVAVGVGVGSASQAKPEPKQLVTAISARTAPEKTTKNAPATGTIPLPPAGLGEHWVLVDLSDQTTTAMIGDEVYYTALASTGKDGWETPIGEFTIIYRVEDETMTSASIGAEEFYVLEHVLYTQYFTTEGHALHLNYWRPDYVFGTERTSHGCVGLRLSDAEFFWNFVGYGDRVVIVQ